MDEYLLSRILTNTTTTNATGSESYESYDSFHVSKACDGNGAISYYASISCSSYYVRVVGLVDLDHNIPTQSEVKGCFLRCQMIVPPR